MYFVIISWSGEDTQVRHPVQSSIGEFVKLANSYLLPLDNGVTSIQYDHCRQYPWRQPGPFVGLYDAIILTIYNPSDEVLALFQPLRRAARFHLQDLFDTKL
jgi:hypothetical protein